MKIKILILIILSIIILVVTPFIGKKNINSKYTLVLDSFSEFDSQIIVDIRIPQTLMAFLVGFGLSLCGLLYQTMFQNDLASPFTLGISGGAAFGAVVAIKINMMFNIFSFSSVIVISFITGFATVLLLILLPSIKKVFDNYSLLLTGIALNFFFSALILLVYYLSNFSETFRIHRWLMGTIDEIGYINVYLMSGVTFFILAICYYFREDLNLLLLSDEIAHTRGLDIKKFKIILLVISSVLIALVVATCGPIGFIGIICPHITKLIFGYNHKTNIISSGLLGGVFLAICFTFSRIIIFPFIIPVGVVTAFFGGPFLIFLLYRKR